MKFWIVKCVDMSTDEKIEFKIAADDNSGKEKIKKDLKSVWPSYKKITLRKAKRPDNWVLFEGIIK